MENERSSSNCHLPEELCREVLSRLPVKSLIRFRCVSKSWLSLISDPEFCLEHCKKWKNNSNQTHLFVVQSLGMDNDMKCCVVRCSESFQTTKHLELPPFCTLTVDWWVEHSIHGLYLLKGMSVDSKELAAVWNPSSRKSHNIPPCNSSSLFDFKLGLGFDPSTMDHKYVRLSFVRHGELKSVEVYNLSSRSWRSVQFQGNNCSEWHWDHILYSKTVYLRGVFNFICSNLNTKVLELVSFDLCSEAFTVIGLPPVFCCSPVDRGIELFGNGDDSSLTLLELRWEKAMSFVLEMESMSWSKPCSLNVKNLKMGKKLFIKSNLEMIMRTDDWSLASYNLETGEENKLAVEKEGNVWFHSADAYCESLFLP